MDTRIKRVENDEIPVVANIINTAAQAYKGVIPRDCCHDPYMPLKDLQSEIVAGVEFLGYYDDGTLRGVMGVQRVKDVHLVRHAYVLPADQRSGIGALLLKQIRAATPGRILIGTWADAFWAIRFYQKHGFALVTDAMKTQVLNTYWTVSDRQLKCRLSCRTHH